jgi:triacylglycerol esterase/lipase EstA (alpha/beta hydrolase family)
LGRPDRTRGLLIRSAAVVPIAAESGEANDAVGGSDLGDRRCSVGCAGRLAQAGFDQNPILFVHGIEGSGAQFEAQKMRFMSNGYSERRIEAVDSTRPARWSTRAIAIQIDEKIAELKQRTGRSQVDVVAHSLSRSSGTTT